MSKHHFGHRYLNPYLQVHGNGKELWVSPQGTKKAYFFTTRRTSMKKIKRFNPLEGIDLEGTLKLW